MAVIFLLDFPYTNYDIKVYDNDIYHLLNEKPVKSSISNSLVTKTKTSELSRETIGEISTNKYLNEDDALVVDTRLKQINDLISGADVIVCMGALSSKLMTGHGIKKAIGRIHQRSENQQVYCTWHPDQIYSSYRIKRDWVSHLSDIQNLVASSKNSVSKNLKTTKTRLIGENDLGEILRAGGHDTLVMDIETSRHEFVDMISINVGDPKLTYVVELPSPNFANLVMHGRRCVFHKGTYDVPFLTEQCGLDLTKIKLSDTSYLARNYEPDQLYALHEIQKRYAVDWPQWKQFGGKIKS